LQHRHPGICDNAFATLEASIVDAINVIIRTQSIQLKKTELRYNCDKNTTEAANKKRQKIKNGMNLVRKKFKNKRKIMRQKERYSKTMERKDHVFSGGFVTKKAR